MSVLKDPADTNGKSSAHMEYAHLHKLIGIMLITGVPLLAFSIYIGYLSGSLSVVAIILDTGVAFFLNLTSYFVLGIVMQNNIFQFPYGPGKLENFTSYLHGLSILLVGSLVCYQGILRVDAPAIHVNLGIAQLALVAGLVRISLVVLYLAKLLRSRTEHSPLLVAYYVNCSTTLWYALAMLTTMLTGWLLSSVWGDLIELYIDLLIAATFSLYLALSGIKVVRSNFHALLDLPLPEGDQLQILNILARHYHSFANIGNIRTRTNGGKKRIELELLFPAETSLRQIEELRCSLQRALEEGLGTVEFELIVRGK